MDPMNYPATIPAILAGEETPPALHINLTVLPNEGGEWTVDVTDLEQFADHPRRKRGYVTVRDVDSLITYIMRHREDGTIASCDDGGAITAHLNHHAPSGGVLATGIEPGWGDHRVQLVRLETPSYQAWQRANGTMMSQEQFGEFLEDRIGEIVDPPGAELFEVVQFFKAQNDIAFSSSKLLTNGQVQLHYTENLTASGGREGDLNVPTEFKILMRPYQLSKPPEAGVPDHEQFVVTARLRWRLERGIVRFAFHLTEELQAFMDALHADVMARVATVCEIPVLRGSIQ